MSRLRTAIILFTSFLVAACGHTQAVVEINSCAKPTADGKHQLRQVPELLELGNDFLNAALHSSSKSEIVSIQAMLRQSGDCFGRALRFAPDSYEAQLSMSVVYLARARMADKGSSDRASLLEGARHMLGRAYMLRHGAYEPLYYLAQVAMEDGKLDLARKFLEPLRAAGVKEGPVNTLLGSLSERQGKEREATEFYRKAVAAGWPSETLIFAANRLRKLGTGGR